MDVRVNGSGYAFVASDTFGLAVLNVATPSAPSVVGGSNEPFFGRHVAIAGTRAVVAGQTDTGLAHLWVLDVSVPSNPTVLGELSSSVSATFRAIVLNGTGTLAVATLGGGGIWVIDLTTPSAPALLGTYPTPTGSEGVALDSTSSLAYVASGSGLLVLSLANPRVPTLVGSLNPGWIWHDVAVVGTLAYLSNQTGSLDVIDVSVASTPHYLRSTPLSGSPVQISVSGTQAAVHVGAGTNDVVDIVSLATPASPVRTGSLTIGPAGTVEGLTLLNGQLYVAAGTHGLMIFSLSSASLLGTTKDTFVGTDVAMAGTIAVVIGGDTVTNTVRLKVIDVHTPTDPVLVGQLPTNIPWNSLRPLITLNSTGTLAVATLGGSGVWVINLSTPSAPAHVGTYATPTGSEGVVLNATNSLAYVASGSGLLILSLANPALPSLVGSLNPGWIWHGVAVAGTLAYVTNQTGSLDVIDVSVPSAPHYLRSATLSGAAYQVSVSGTQAAVRVGVGTNDVLDLVSLATPATPVRTGSITVGAAGTFRGLSLLNGQAFVAANTLGLKIYNFSSPGSAPVTADVPGAALAVVAQGRAAYVADFPATLDVLSW